MRRVAYLFGWIALTLAVVLILLGTSTWPPDGLMFALPLVFLVPDIFLTLLGTLLLGSDKSKRGRSCRTCLTLKLMRSKVALCRDQHAWMLLVFCIMS